ncbi:MAG: hypothetical protein AAGE85_12610 [Pseudomonadota bacterium]
MRTLIALALLIHSGATPLQAAERIEYRMPAGFTYSFDSLTESRSVVDMISAGQSTTLEQTYEQHIQGAVEVLEASGGTPTELRIRFDQSSGSKTIVSGTTQETPFALAGRTIEVTVLDEQVVSITDGSGRNMPLDDETRSVVAELAIAERAILPGRAVGIGDQWTADLVREDRPLAPKLTLEVAGFGEQAGRRIVKLDVDGPFEGAQQGLDMQGDVSGPIIVDVESGLPLSSRLSGTAAISGELEQNGSRVTLTGNQTIKISSRSQIGGAAVVAASAPHAGTESQGIDKTAPGGWKEFRHSSGATLLHPPTWRPEEFSGGVRFQPAEAGAAETIVATGMASNGTTDPLSPAVASYLDTSLQQMLPGLRRTAAPVSIAAANGQGALYRYAGTQFDGSEIASSVYVTIENGVALSLSAVAPPDTLRSREATLAKIFASMKFGSVSTATMPAGGSTPTGNDPRLVGMFAGEALAGGGDYGAYVNTQLVSVLNADGTLYYGAQSHFSASQRDFNGNLKWTASGNTDGSVQSGRWSARGGFLTIRWDAGGQSVFAYGFEPDGSLVLRNPTTRKLINFYRRVR